MGNYYKPKLSERWINIINCWAIFLILLGILLLALGYGIPGPLTAGLFALRIIGFLLLGIGLLLLLWACFYCCAKHMNKKTDSYKEYRTKTDGAWVYLTPNSEKVYQANSNSFEVNREKASSSALSTNGALLPNNDQFYSPPFVREFKTIRDKTISSEPLYPKFHTVHNKQFAWTKNTVVEVDKHNIKQGVLHEELIAYPISDSIIFSPPPPYEAFPVSRAKLSQDQYQEMILQSAMQRSAAEQQQNLKDQALIHLSNELQQRLDANSSMDMSSGLHEKTGVKTIYVNPLMNQQISEMSTQNQQIDGISMHTTQQQRGERSTHAQLATTGQNSAIYDNTGMYTRVKERSFIINPGIQQQSMSVNNESSSQISQGSAMSASHVSPRLHQHQSIRSEERSLIHANSSVQEEGNSSIVINPTVHNLIRVEDISGGQQKIVYNENPSIHISPQMHQRQAQSSMVIHSRTQPFALLDGKSTEVLSGSNQWVTDSEKSLRAQRVDENSSVLFNPVTQQWVTVKQVEQQSLAPGMQHFVMTDENSQSMLHSVNQQTNEQNPNIVITPESQQWVTIEQKSSTQTSPDSKHWMKVEQHSSANTTPRTQNWITLDEKYLTQKNSASEDWVTISNKSSRQITPATEYLITKGDSSLMHSTPVKASSNQIEENSLIYSPSGAHHWVSVEETSSAPTSPRIKHWTSTNGIFSTRTTPRIQQKIITEENFMTNTIPRRQQWISPGEKPLSPISTGKQHWITVEGKFPVKSSEIHHKIEDTSTSRLHTDWIYSPQNSSGYSQS